MAGRRFLQLVYHMPAKPTAGRVAVWRSLKKAGAVYLQDSVCVLPETEAAHAELLQVLERIDQGNGTYHLLPLGELPEEEEQKLVQLFVDQTAKHYAEIVENCEVNFVKEIEFEHFRENYSYEEAEEIRMEFEKLGTWFERVKERDWFDAPHRRDAERWLEKCERLLEDFEAKVFEVLGTSEGAAPTLRVVASSESQ